MKAEKIPKPITVWKKERLDLILSQIAEPMPKTRTTFHKVKYQEFAAACVWLKSRGSVAKDRIHNPEAIEGVKPAVKNHTFYYDPTYILDEDAVLPCGKVVHKAGTTVNPLEHMDLNRRLFFVDSREKDQVKWLKA